MFRIGGSANEEGIISIAKPRKQYAEGGDIERSFQRNRDLLRSAVGGGRSQDDRLSELLISGGLNLMSARPSGNIFSTAASAFKEPTSQYLKSAQDERNFGRQLDLSAATTAITSADAERLARLKIKNESENQELIEQTKLLQLSGITNPYAVAKTQIDFKKKFGEDIATTPVNRDEKGKLSARQLAGISTGQVFLINDPKSGLITARKTDEAGNFQLIDPLTNKVKVPPAVTPPKTYSEIISQNPLSIRRNTLMQEYLKKQQEKKKNISSMGD
jgi:hypothetical protein